jgi:hypothetical protein
MQAERLGGWSKLDEALDAQLRDARLGRTWVWSPDVEEIFDNLPLELEAEAIAEGWHDRLPLGDRY